MAIIKKLCYSTPHSSQVKIKTDESGGEIQVTLDELCYRSDPVTLDFNTDPKNKFATVDKNFSRAFPVAVVWGGHSQEGKIRVYRGSKDLEHLLFSACVGDTCEFDMEGDVIHADTEYSNKEFIFVIEKEVTLWMRIHKTGFRNYVETASFGIKDNESTFGVLKEDIAIEPEKDSEETANKDANDGEKGE